MNDADYTQMITRHRARSAEAARADHAEQDWGWLETEVVKAPQLTDQPVQLTEELCATHSSNADPAQLTDSVVQLTVQLTGGDVQLTKNRCNSLNPVQLTADELCATHPRNDTTTNKDSSNQNQIQSQIQNIVIDMPEREHTPARSEPERFCRECPICGKTLEYSKKNVRDRAERNHSSCQSCANHPARERRSPQSYHPARSAQAAVLRLSVEPRTNTTPTEKQRLYAVLTGTP